MKKMMSMAVFLFFATAIQVFTAESLDLAVLHFTNNSDDRGLNYLEEAIPEMLITNLTASPEIRVLERTRIVNILEEQQLSLSGVIDESEVVEIGKLIGADVLVYGSIFVGELQMRIDARAVSTEDGSVRSGVKVLRDISGGMDVIGMIDELAEKIIEALTREQVTIAAINDVPDFQPVAGKALAAAVILDNTHRMSGSECPVYLLVSMKAGKILSPSARVPLNICMVMDKSGSMESEKKLEYVKQAGLFVIDNLERDDHFSLVTYDTHVYTPVDAGPVRNKSSVKEIIRQIEPGSSTNLSGGMLEGYAQVLSFFDRESVNRVLLLTDGLANTGITNPNLLKKIVQEKNRDAITLSTFGVGIDFNEDLLTMLSEFGGANYHFIHQPEDIPAIFNTELQGLLSVVAQNAKIEIKMADGVSCSHVFGYVYETDGNVVRVNLNDIFSDEDKSILLKFNVPEFSANDMKLCNVVLTYDDVIRSHRRIREAYEVKIISTKDEKLVNQNRNTVVHENIALYESTRLLDETMSLIDERNFEAADKKILDNMRLLRSNVNHASSKRLKQQMLNVVKYSEAYQDVAQMDAAEVKEMQKSMKYKNYLQKKKK
ncbi:MAG: VWA domain-containing protein [candidate division KSB1 bacterium]|jgi:Ca-activated chloride channel family protein|nr:VWA domain-containing protein [candidate division KSB1 bacterium]